MMHLMMTGNPLLVDRGYSFALHTAISKEGSAIVKLLIANGADLNVTGEWI